SLTAQKCGLLCGAFSGFVSCDGNGSSVGDPHTPRLPRMDVMMESSVNSFFEAISADPHLQNAVAVAPDARSLSELAATRGLNISAADLRAAIGEDLEIECLESRALSWGVAYLSFKDLGDR